jgi:hypothetical protein
MPQKKYETESLGSIIAAIVKTQKNLSAIRPSVRKGERKRLDLRFQALQESREILSKACKTAPKMNAFFAGPPEE